MYSPVKPESMNWGDLYPLNCNKDVEFLDIGCGYGGLLGKLGNQNDNKARVSFSLLTDLFLQ